MCIRAYKRLMAFFICCIMLFGSTIVVKAEPECSAASAVLIEASTGTIIYEKNFTERRSPASITKIMTLLLTFENLKSGNIHLDDTVTVSEYASSMGGSQVFLAQGETQSLETMIKCIVVASGNDACVAVAEHIAGSEANFVDMMNSKAEELGMSDTHFEDCCGLTDSDGHYSSARDVAIMSRELITKYPEIYNYSKIWMENITHVTRQGSSIFTLNSTNKLLKQYPYTTGLKTGSTSKALYCLSATATKDDIDLIAVIMGAPDTKTRFAEAQTLLGYGFSLCKIYIDDNSAPIQDIEVKGGVMENVSLRASGEFRYLDIEGNDLSKIERIVEIPECAIAPVSEGDIAGNIKYILGEREIGSVPIVFAATVEKAHYIDYLKKAVGFFLL